MQPVSASLTTCSLKSKKLKRLTYFSSDTGEGECHLTHTLRSRKWSLTPIFPTTVSALLTSSVRVTCSAHRIVLDFVMSKCRSVKIARVYVFPRFWTSKLSQVTIKTSQSTLWLLETPTSICKVLYASGAARLTWELLSLRRCTIVQSASGDAFLSARANVFPLNYQGR
jgi:hypothetical protein